ncbi:hypothetical protein [Bradyrhizobium prioriisuperbiae]|uniref:hypothetical protein n=1 Tax=Bradyrhizobium prioriisuperbiae TaxID=2854389 RepID=UPI0028EC8F79|nr:hypothetical protein [Bradyrhizobium prioritasuperba]
MASVVSADSTPRAFGRKSGRSLPVAVRLAFVRAYRALTEARMRRIRMELRLHGVHDDRDPDRKA